MKAIYKPTGKAKEYGNLACNLYRGCGHGCTYCYAPNILRMDRQEFYNNPQPRKGIIEAFRKDAKRIGDEYKECMRCYNRLICSPDLKPIRPEVFLCFTSDAYQAINAEHQLTRQAIEILHANEIAVNILTKGIITDFDLLAKRPDLSKVGITLDGTENFKEHLKRTENLSTAKVNHISTWISLEPVINPEGTLRAIRLTHIFTDHYKLGKWNYDPRAKDIDWHKLVNETIELFEELGCNYYIKEDLRKYIK